MFGMLMVFPKLALRCALDPFAWPELPEKEPEAKAAAPELDEPKDGE